MVDLIMNTLKNIVKLKKVHTDNNVFKLHYKVTVTLLLIFSVLLTSKQYFGSPINCDVDEKDRKEVIETFCWISGTFIIKRTLNNRRLPGLGLGNIYEEDPSAGTSQIYYQWVCIAFCAQAMVFYLPKYLWRTWEGGRLEYFVKDLSEPVTTAKWTNETKDGLVKYLLHSKQTLNIYAVRYCFCEVLNFINVIAQIYFMDWLIAGQFSLYGIVYATFNMYKQVNPMDAVFPKITKCTYNKVGPSGTEVSRDALCILPLNVLNEKLFLILWYWLFILLIVSFLSLLYRALFLFIPKFRVYLLRAQTRSLDKKKSQVIVKYLSYGDFFLLYKIGKNVNPILYKELVSEMYNCIVSKESLYKNFPQNSLSEA